MFHVKHFFPVLTDIKIGKITNVKGGREITNVTVELI